MDKVIDGVYPQTNYTTQQFYTKEEYDKLQAENERLKLSERDLSRICQAFKKDIETEKSYKQKYYKALQEIREIAEKMYNTNDEDTERDLHIELQTKINEVIGAE